MAELVQFPHELPKPTMGPPAGWIVVEGDPQASAWRHYTSQDGKLLAGLWTCTPGTFHVTYVKWEFCHLLSGSCTIVPEGKAAVTLTAGDAFVLEPGFEGKWVIHETMTKHFVFSD